MARATTPTWGPPPWRYDPPPMSLPLIAVLFLVILALGYWRWSGFVARQLALDPKATTPAHVVNDGADFVPTRPFYLFGQHFSAIAAAGPIAGPILASQQFGWLPCLVWITFGVRSSHTISTMRRPHSEAMRI